MAIITQSLNLTAFVSTSTSMLSTVPATQTVTVDTGKAFYVLANSSAILFTGTRI